MEDRDGFGLSLPIEARDADELKANRIARQRHYDACKAADPQGVTAFEQQTAERIEHGREALNQR